MINVILCDTAPKFMYKPFYSNCDDKFICEAIKTANFTNIPLKLCFTGINYHKKYISLGIITGTVILLIYILEINYGK